MAGALVQSTTFPWAVSSESKIGSKQSGKKRKARMMRSLQTPPMRVRTFSGLWGVNGLDNMVFHSTVAVATSVSREKASQIVPKAMFELFRENANKVIKFAQEEARRSGYNFVGTELILLGHIGDGDDIYHGDIAAKVLRSMGIYLNHARVEVADMTGGGSGFDSLETPFTPCALHAFELSLEEAQLLGHNYIGSEHLLLGLLRAGEGVNLVLRNLGASTNNIRVQVIKMVEESAEVVGGKSSRNKMPTLVAYGINLTELADEKKLCPVVGSQPLIRSAIQNLGRVTKKNPCLVGGRGVGKTSIAEGVAQSITAFDLWVPDCLCGKQVITLDMHLLVQGWFVERLKKLVEEIKQNGEIILFIDDVHTLFGAGVAEGAIGAANILRRALARGELQCIGSTTLEEYRKHIEKDPTLERLFQPVKVPEPTVYETINILMEIKEYYEHHHKVRYTREALVAAAHLSYECLSDRCLPGKAIDLIDEAGTFVRSGEFDLPYSELLKTLEFVRKHLLITKEEIATVGDKELEKAGMLWDQEMHYRTEILEIEKRIKEVKKNAIEVDTTVTEADIETIVSSWSMHN